MIHVLDDNHSRPVAGAALAGRLVPRPRVAQGFGYEITGAEVWMAHAAAMKAAEALGRAPETKERIRKLASDRRSFVTDVLGRELAHS